MNYEFTLTFDGDDYKIVIDGNSVLVNGQPFVVGFDPDGGHVLVDGIPFDVTFDPQAEQALVGGIARTVTVEGLEAEKPGPRAAGPAVVSEGAVTAIMPGKIIRLLIAEGDTVAEGDVICILEAMKMENELKAPRAGTVTTLYVEPGQDVESGAVLAEIE